MNADPTNLAVVGISWAISALLALSLWRKPGHPAGKVAWTVLLAAPVVGPVLYAVLHDPPTKKAGCSSCAMGSCGAGELTSLGGGRGDADPAGDGAAGHHP